MKKTIAVIFGGKSAEHDVSIITAHIPIIQSLLAAEQFNVVPIYIATDGSWYSDQAMNDLGYFKVDNFSEKLSKQKKVELRFDNGLHLVFPRYMRQKSIKIDAVFPSMHGTYGEDGSLPGLLRMASVPFVGCDLFASAVAMDKVLTKQVISSEGIPVVPFVWFTKSDWEKDKEEWKEKIEKLKWPVFVKPAHLGSSIGITKVKQSCDLENAIEVGLHYDDKILVEESVENLIEVTLPIMGNDILHLAAIERTRSTAEFFDFTDKYLSGEKKHSAIGAQYSELPAKIDPLFARQVEEFGRKTYRVLGCSGIARIDFLIESATRHLYVNEVNTLPGSLYHHNWRSVGISGVELVTKLISLAEERFASSQKIAYSFRSDILKKVGDQKTRSEE